MTRRSRCATALVAALSAGACGRSDTPREEPASPVSATAVYRGHARRAHEVRAFVPCDSTSVLWVVDSSQALWAPYDELASDPADTTGRFAVVEGRVTAPPADGFGAGYAGALIVERVLYVAREGYGCAAPWARFAFRAFGNEPFWSLTLAGDSIALVRPGEVERTWHVSRDSTATGLRMVGGNPATDGIALLLRPEPCRDSMAGSYFAFTATVLLAGDSLAGCALKGEGR